MGRDSYEDGMKVRRKMLGDAWVDRSLANRNDFNAEIQQQITRQAWGEVWTRPGIDTKTRRFHGPVYYDRAARVGRIPFARAFWPEPGRSDQG